MRLHLIPSILIVLIATSLIPITIAQPPTSTPIVDEETGVVGLVARVNGEEITQEQFDREVLRRAQNSLASDPIALQLQILDSLIQQIVINQAAEEFEIVISDEELAAELTILKESIADDDEAWLVWLETNNFTEEELLTALHDSLITNEVRDRQVISLEGSVLQVHARHILVRTVEEGEAVVARLDAGEDFVAVAAEVSQDTTTRDQGGDLGWFTKEELIDVTLAEVAFSMEPGEVEGPIPSRIGYHVIQVLEKAERPIEPERMPLLMETQFLTWLQAEYDRSEIEIFFDPTLP